MRNDRLEKVKKEYFRWKKEQKEKKTSEDSLNWGCYFFPIFLIIIALCILFFTISFF